ncbi:MAG TPA: DUF1501 domain-containing protein [Pirellulales bacterium]|nr:DUF1501 domain-containing protein [Pirellulales bacterium]
MSFLRVPDGMTRRHFMTHLAGASAMMVPAMSFTNSVLANATDLRRRHKSCIMLWMGGGPATIDMWDLKPGQPTGGEFRNPISTSLPGLEICEHLPLMSKQMHNLAVVRSMSTKEADHNRGRYYMHTGYVPNPNIEHPSYGAVIAHELAAKVPELEIPPFVSVGGGSEGPGFLGMTWAPFVVSQNGDVRDLRMGVDQNRLQQRMAMLKTTETSFMNQVAGGDLRSLDNGGPTTPAGDHAKIIEKTIKLMTSKQMEAFKVGMEPKAVQDRYGQTGFGKGCLMARRLVELGVPFIEVDLGGWDTHANNFTTLKNQKLPELDKAFAALVADLKERSLLDDTVIVWLGEFGRTPRINGGAGRDHWARSWSVVVGGGGFKRGTVVGKTNADGTLVESEPYTSQDLMASVCKAMGISLDTTFTSNNGRPMKIANSGKVIKELFA